MCIGQKTLKMIGSVKLKSEKAFIKSYIKLPWNSCNKTPGFFSKYDKSAGVQCHYQFSSSQNENSAYRNQMVLPNFLWYKEKKSCQKRINSLYGCIMITPRTTWRKYCKSRWFILLSIWLRSIIYFNDLTLTFKHDILQSFKKKVKHPIHRQPKLREKLTGDVLL